MDNLIIKSTHNTPSIKIDINTKTFEISGVSLPENPHEFYNEIIEYLKTYNHDELTIICDLIYSNSSSTKSILLMLKKCIQSIKNVKIIWIYDIDDDDIKDLGEDIQQSIGAEFEFRIRLSN